MVDFLRNGPSAGPGIPTDALREQALGIAADAREKLIDGEQQLRTFIKDKPATALGIALGVGVFLGWLIKRR